MYMCMCMQVFDVIGAAMKIPKDDMMGNATASVRVRVRVLGLGLGSSNPRTT